MVRRSSLRVPGGLLPPEEEAFPAYPEYSQVRDRAGRTKPRFSDPGYLLQLQDVIDRRGWDWCTGVLGRAFPGLRSTGGLESHMLIVADEMGLTPPLPQPIIDAREASARRKAELEEAHRRLEARDQETWQTARRECDVTVEVRANARGGRRTNTGLDSGPLRHVTPLQDVVSGRSRLHPAGHALCETAQRRNSRRALELGDPVDKPGTCKACLAWMPKVRPAEEGTPL